jgi:hypothetical protein
VCSDCSPCVLGTTRTRSRGQDHNVDSHEGWSGKLAKVLLQHLLLPMLLRVPALVFVPVAVPELVPVAPDTGIDMHSAAVGLSDRCP